MNVVQCYELFGGIALKKSRIFIFKQCVGMPGLCDHDIVFVETSSRDLRHMPVRRKILLCKHANFLIYA